MTPAPVAVRPGSGDRGRVLSQWLTRLKLRRGQCRACRRPLRDDAPATDRFCSDACFEDYRARADW